MSSTNRAEGCVPPMQSVETRTRLPSPPMHRDLKLPQTRVVPNRKSQPVQSEPEHRGNADSQPEESESAHFEPAHNDPAPSKPKKKHRRFITRSVFKRRARAKLIKPRCLVKNFSSLDLKNVDLSLLECGGSYVPLPKRVNLTDLESGIRRLDRICQWKFHLSENDVDLEPPHPFLKGEPKFNYPPVPPPKALSDLLCP